jgi:Glycosyltransferase sugar-binding region containing DXD motif
MLGWHPVAVPRRYLLVWIGDGFEYPYRLTVDSILQADPAAEVEIHLVGPRPSSVHFTAMVDSDARISLHHVDLDRLFATHPRCRAVFDSIPRSAPAALSNLVRYALLHRRGGVYVDFDVLLQRGVHDIAGGRPFIGVERVWAHDRPRLEGRWTWRMLPGTTGWALAWAARRADSRLLHGRAKLGDRLRLVDPLWSELQPNNAVIGAAAGCAFVEHLLDAAASVDPTVRYALGPSLVTSVAAANPGSVQLLREAVFYPVPPGESHRFFEDRTLSLRSETALIHYVNSNHRALMRTIEPGDQRFTTRTEVFWQIARTLEANRNRVRRGELGGAELVTP